MANVCPVCGRRVGSLVRKHLQVWHTNDRGQNYLVGEDLRWECPECGAVLFQGFPDSETEAEKWLAQS
jgi:ribosomal protein L37AE/L43A